MKAKNTGILFLCEITEHKAILATLACEKNGRRRFRDLEIRSLAEGDHARQLAELFRRHRYARDPVILSVPHKYASSRVLRIPASTDQEMEKILSLQASRLLPASQDELITGFQFISRDKDGFAKVNLVIVQKAIIVHYCRLLTQAGIKDFSITLSSLGLFNLCQPVLAGSSDIRAVIEIDPPQAEICFCSEQALLFSRSFMLSDPWIDRLKDEYRKTAETFAKEDPANKPQAVVLVGPCGLYSQLKPLASMGADPFPYWEMISAEPGFISALMQSDISCAGLIGTGLRAIPESMNFLPVEMKRSRRTSGTRRELTRIAVFLAAASLAFGAGLYKTVAEKRGIERRLAGELAAIEKEARPLEQQEKNEAAFAGKGASCLELLREIHGLIPPGTLLSSFLYEGAQQVVLRGHAQQLNQVFTLASDMERSKTFSGYTVRIKSTSEQRGKSSGGVDFEIVCQGQKR